MIRVVPWQNPTLSSTHFQQTLETKWNLKKWSFLNLFFFKLKTTKTQWHHKGNKQRLQGLVSNACFVFNTPSAIISPTITLAFSWHLFSKKKKSDRQSRKEGKIIIRTFKRFGQGYRNNIRTKSPAPVSWPWALSSFPPSAPVSLQGGSVPEIREACKWEKATTRKAPTHKVPGNPQPDEQ